MIKKIFLICALCVLIVSSAYAIEPPKKIEKSNLPVIMENSKQLPCEANQLKFVTKNAFDDASYLNKFFNLNLSKQELEYYAKIIEKEVYPLYENGFCNSSEYLASLMNKLNIKYTQKEIDGVLNYINGLKQYRSVKDNLEEPKDKYLYNVAIGNKSLHAALSSLIMDTADVLIGKTYIIIIFVDYPGKSWNSADRSDVFSKLDETANWMEQNAPSSANVSVEYGYYLTTISTDPYACGGDDYYCQCRDWMNEATANIGYVDTNGNGYNIDEMNNFIMDYSGARNVYPIYALHNSNFINLGDPGYTCGYDYIPIIAVPYYEFCILFCNRHESDAYIHESLHAFSARDEYKTPYVACESAAACTRITRWDYVNGNCDYCAGTQDSIMKCCGADSSYWASYYTRGQIGWGDHDGDGILDPLDNCMYNWGPSKYQGCPAPPAVTILSPINNRTYTSSTILIDIAGGDTQYGSYTLSESRDGGPDRTICSYCTAIAYSWTGLSEGKHNLTISASDNMGRTDKKTLVFYIDTIFEDSDNDGTPDINDSCPDVYGTYCHGCLMPACGVCEQPECSTGAPYCYYYCEPELKISSPLNDKWYDSSSVLINASIKGFVGRLLASQDSNDNVILCDNCYEYIGNWTSFSEGKHNLTIFASDYEDRYLWETRTFFIDTVAPTIISQKPADNSTVATLSQINFSIIYSEVNLDKITLFWNTTLKGWNNTNLANCSSGVNKQCSKIMNFSMYPYDTKFNYYIRVYDKTGKSVRLMNQAGKPYSFSQQCAPLLINTSWTAWINKSCLPSNTMNQSRTKVQYDSHNCGQFANKTIYEYRATQPCSFPLSITIINPKRNATLNESTISLNVSTSSKARCNYSLSLCTVTNICSYKGRSNLSTVNGYNHSARVSNLVSTNSSYYKINVTCIDTYSNKTSNSSVQFYVKLPNIPTYKLNIYSPKSGTTTSKTVKINLTTTSVVINITYSDNNGAQKLLCKNCSSYGYSQRKTINLTEGKHNLTFRARTNTLTLINSSILVVDTTKPKIIITLPSWGKYTYGNFSIVYTELNPNKITLYYGNKTDAKTNCPYISGRINQTCLFYENLTAYNGKNITYWFEVRDIAGNIGVSNKTRVYVDTIKPSFTRFNYTISSNNLKWNIRISEYVALDYQDITNSTAWKVLCTNCNYYNKTQSFTKGTHNLSVRAMDKAQNNDIRKFSFRIS